MAKRVVLNLAKINDKLQWGGRLTRSEAHEIKLRLISPGTKDDIHALAIAFSNGVRPYRSNLVLLERLMNSGIDDYELSGVLIGLCNNWRRAHKYCEFLLNITHHRRFMRNYDAAKTAFAILEKNIGKPNFVDVFETLFWRWQELLKPQENPIDGDYIRCLNRVMEVALLGDKVFEPLYNRVGKHIEPEWEEELANILAQRKQKKQKNIFKFGMFDKIFANA